MVISVESNFYIELFEQRKGQENLKFRNLYSRFIYLTILNNLDYLFKPNSLFKRGYERTEELEHTVDSLNLSQEEVVSIYRVEDVIRKNLATQIGNDGHDHYGLYKVGLIGKRRNPIYIIAYFGDYRILEWESGRGKDLDTVDEVSEIEDEIDTLQPISLKPTNVYSLSSKSRSSGLFDAVISNRRTIRNIQNKVDSDLLVTDEELEELRMWEDIDNPITDEDIPGG